MRKVSFILAVGAFVWFCFFFPAAFAADTLNLTYSLVEGGTILELTEQSPYKGVNVSIASNVSTQYEVYQRLTSPLVNRDQPSEVLRDNFVCRGLSGSNRTGNFRIPSSDMPVRSEDLLYVSNSSGGADAFTMVYGVANIADVAPGYYTGKIAFILNPIASSRPQVTQILDINVRVSDEGQLKPKVEISTDSGSKYIVLNPQKQGKQTQDVVVKINGSFRRPFSITQVLAQPLQSSEGYRLEARAVNFAAKEVRKGSAPVQKTELSSAAQNIYNSNPSGDADNYFALTYSLGDLSQAKAGKYRSRLDFYLEEMGAQKKLDTLDLEVEYDRVFDLQINPGDNRFAVEFSNLRPNEPPRVSTIEIKVVSNTAARYQVSQEIASELVDKMGNTIPNKYFTLRTESMDTKGKLQIPANEEIKKGSTVLFVSDSQGAADEFRAVYELRSPDDLRAGDYSTRITYSLVEI